MDIVQEELEKKLNKRGFNRIDELPKSKVALAIITTSPCLEEVIQTILSNPKKFKNDQWYQDWTKTLVLQGRPFTELIGSVQCKNCVIFGPTKIEEIKKIRECRSLETSRALPSLFTPKQSGDHTLFLRDDLEMSYGKFIVQVIHSLCEFLIENPETTIQELGFDFLSKKEVEMKIQKCNLLGKKYFARIDGGLTEFGKPTLVGVLCSS